MTASANSKLIELIRNDSLAVSFQSLGRYRSALIKCLEQADVQETLDRICESHEPINTPCCPVCLLQERDSLAAENEQLRGLRPAAPPRPPNGSGLPRYGLRWSGPSLALSVPMDDGYWTPWHLATAALEDEKGSKS